MTDAEFRLILKKSDSCLADSDSWLGGSGWLILTSAPTVVDMHWVCLTLTVSGRNCLPLTLLISGRPIWLRFGLLAWTECNLSYVIVAFTESCGLSLILAWLVSIQFQLESSCCFDSDCRLLSTHVDWLWFMCSPAGWLWFMLTLPGWLCFRIWLSLTCTESESLWSSLTGPVRD